MLFGAYLTLEDLELVFKNRSPRVPSEAGTSSKAVEDLLQETVRHKSITNKLTLSPLTLILALMTSVSKYLVTGANRGIGYAAVKGILLQNPNHHVILGCRDPAKGQLAVANLSKEIGSDVSGRAEVIALDTSSDDSVKAAAKALDGVQLQGIVNNGKNCRVGHQLSTLRDKLTIMHSGSCLARHAHQHQRKLLRRQASVRRLCRPSREPWRAHRHAHLGGRSHVCQG